MATTVDEAIESLGTGRFQRAALCATGLTWSGDAMELAVLAYVLPRLRDEFGLSQAVADGLASTVFAGMLIGSLAWGAFSDAYGRRRGWLVTTALTALAGLASALTPDGAVFVFFVARALVGIGLAGLIDELDRRLAADLVDAAKAKLSAQLKDECDDLRREARSRSDLGAGRAPPCALAQRRRRRRG